MGGIVEEVTSLEDLVERLAGVKRIGIDGMNGVRKTSVADFLCQRLGLSAVHTDDFLERNQGGYVNFLRYDELASELRSLGQFIIEGVCLLQVLERIGVNVDAVVCIKRFHLNLWADERELNVPLAQLDEFLRKEHETVEFISGERDDGGPRLSDDVVRYHSTYQPHVRSQLLYRWDDT
jgi:hypothetical protein